MASSSSTATPSTAEVPAALGQVGGMASGTPPHSSPAFIPPMPSMGPMVSGPMLAAAAAAQIQQQQQQQSAQVPHTSQAVSSPMTSVPGVPAWLLSTPHVAPQWGTPSAAAIHQHLAALAHQQQQQQQQEQQQQQQAPRGGMASGIPAMIPPSLPLQHLQGHGVSYTPPMMQHQLQQQQRQQPSSGPPPSPPAGQQPLPPNPTPAYLQGIPPLHLQ
eukprot:1144261-Pelagomonas_calceolata.AAC.7